MRMSKAILVMDMPKNCYECNLRFTNLSCEDICSKDNKYIEVNIFERKPNWCPLREVPQKKDYEVLKAGARGYGKTQNMLSNAHINGYNACIDEILKGAEENGQIDRH